MNYARAIKAIRASRQMEQRDLADGAKLDPSYISLIESSRRSPSAAALESIASALDVPLYLLILLASDEQDLRGLSSDEAGELGRNLLDVLLKRDEQHLPAGGSEWKRR